MDPVTQSGQSRRDFLGTLGLVFALPSFPSIPAVKTTRSDDEANFSGSLRDLASGLHLDHGWRWEFDALIGSVDQPRSEWIVGPQSRLEIAMDWCSLSPQQIASLLKTSGIRTQCEIDFSYREQDGSNDKDCFAEIVVCESQSHTRELWKQVEACRKDWELMPSKLAGEMMFISNGGNSMPGKSWFVRANVLASVVTFFMPQESGAEFAAKLDKHIRNCLQEL